MSEPAGEFDALMARARAGDAEALEQLARQYEPKVRIVARVLLGPALRPYLDSMDLVQSVHRSLLAGLQQEKFDLTAPDKLVALALTMVRRKAADHWRRLRRQHRLSGAADREGGVAEQIIALAGPQADPAREAEYRDAVERLCRHLDDTERRLMELRLGGYRTSEAARELGLDADVLRVRLSRLRRRLKEAGVLADWL